MYNDELNEQTIPIGDLYLDPNNPRFWGVSIRPPTPNDRIIEESVQRRVVQETSKHGIDELYYSILRNGFLPLDRIVVQPLKLKEVSGKYVVVEGNRRLAALMLLRRRIEGGMVSEEHITDAYLGSLVEQTNEIKVLVYRGRRSASEGEDIAWALQGIRHIGGIRNWEPAQRAKLVADQVEEKSISFTEAGQRFGLSAQAAGRLYRTHKALQQMREDDEFGDKAQNDYFSLFEEAYRNLSVREWLDWDEDDYRFKNPENLQCFYSWITPDNNDDNDGSKPRRRIHDPKQVKDLGLIVGGGHESLISEVERYEINIEEAAVVARPSGSLEKQLQKILNAVRSLSGGGTIENPKKCLDLSDEVIESINRLKEQITGEKFKEQAVNERPSFGKPPRIE